MENTIVSSLLVEVQSCMMFISTTPKGRVLIWRLYKEEVITCFYTDAQTITVRYSWADSHKGIFIMGSQSFPALPLLWELNKNSGYTKYSDLQIPTLCNDMMIIKTCLICIRIRNCSNTLYSPSSQFRSAFDTMHTRHCALHYLKLSHCDDKVWLKWFQCKGMALALNHDQNALYILSCLHWMQ